MSTYFSDFPIISYDMNKDGTSFPATNIIKRYKPLEDIINKSVLYYEYTIKEGERPDIVSFNVYNSIKYHWVILMFNKVIDPYFDWPLHYDEFNSFVEHKYGSIQSSTQTVHHYEKILQDSSKLTDGTIIHQRTAIIDSTAYDALAAEDKKIIYNYDYEFKLNETRRVIKILDETYLPQLEEEKKRIFDGS